ncbi:hypothetical protein LMTR13_07535 [Bradyrhizobium icense]|uniref:Uncharacterized protein n=1 Tax=Bradyrhizobium icense TaxID=1274631 RepID=A0A1B1UBA7_9BRAD|nr:hypothetical protein LMTR13_07535 [Bradyrhizobium icense]
MPGLVPGIFVFGAWARAVIARKRSDEAIHTSNTRRDGLLRFAHNDGFNAWNSKELRPHARINFFIIFVDGLFTTFVEWPFTKSSHAMLRNHAMSCV